MSTLTDQITAHFTPEQLAQVGGAEIYLQQALARFNQDNPQLATNTVTLVDSPIVPLPTDWTEGFSRPYRIHYPVASAPVSVESPNTGHASAPFTEGDWRPRGDLLVLVIQHDLNSQKIITQIWRGSTEVKPIAVDAVTENVIEIVVSKRYGAFTGTALLEVV